MRVGNGAGAVVSSAATLTVTTPVADSPLRGRGWAAGVRLEDTDDSVHNAVSAIDDAGRATVVFTQTKGGRNTLHATRGTPGMETAAPRFSAPVVIDTPPGGAPLTVAMFYSAESAYRVASAPNGNAVVVWSTDAPCTASSYATTGTCGFLYSARFIASSGTWQAPVVVADSPSQTFHDVQINDAGDIALRYTGWQRSAGSNSYATVPAIAWRAGGNGAFQRRLLTGLSATAQALRLDGGGNLLVVGQASQNATTDVVAHRGNVAGAFGDPLTLDTRGAPVTFLGGWLGTQGHALVLWRQSNGSTDVLYAATAAASTAAFVVTDLGPGWSTPSILATVDDDGAAIVHDVYFKSTIRGSAGVWSPKQALPAELSLFSFTIVPALARNGSILAVDVTTGVWSTYDAPTNTMVRRPDATSPGGAGLLLGVQNTSGGLRDLRLSVSGFGTATLVTNYDVLPSPSLPAGDKRSVTSVWGLYLQ